ncbi:MAG: signal peptidase [Deltaproteobacteria bacterium]|nr:signal peptidase [Deltaproteobacteria bacterium]
MNTPGPETQEMRLAVGVQYRTASTIYTYLTDDEALSSGDRVMVESELGRGMATVIVPPRQVPKASLPSNVRKLLHRASPEEIHGENLKREKALACFRVADALTHEYQLPLKLVDGELVEDGKKIRFVFSAEDRIDFRGLVKDLARQLNLRIEMIQVGARDETKYRGCLGACGQVTTCCSTFLRQFRPISIGMAKAQGLAPNPAKLTGLCGKLKCCLAYEQEQYLEARKDLLKMGAVVRTPRGVGKIAAINILARQYSLRLDEGGESRFAAAECTPLSSAERTARDRALEMQRGKEQEAREEKEMKREKRQSRLREKK